MTDSTAIPRIALIGAGGIAGAHMRGYTAHADRIKVVAVVDPVTANAERRAEEAGGATVYATLDDLLATAPDSIDAVDICLPHHLHRDAIVKAAEAGKHILCEKPLCLTPEEAADVRAAVTSSGVTLMCAHNQLYMPPVAKARELLHAGEIGKVYELRTTDSFYNNFDPANAGWRAKKETSGGGELIDTGYHPTYLLLNLAASAPAAVSAMISSHRLEFMDGEDSAQVLVRFADGAVGHLVTSWAYNPAGCTERFSAVGEKGSLWSDGKSLWVRQNGAEAVKHEFEDIENFVAEIADWAEVAAGRKGPVNGHEEGLAVLDVILAAYTSAAEGRTVSIG
ncbi:dehydrogenase [Mangrovactinospora gilvigrisea]|uniref:Dehydrogenase n=1 Tax=Mangrovactinospora gilvigrisea TaxID=1428644 RepID=A0A1J7BI31_9ACTN|nr:Gfo/Idh/MocA family oxidoreductase [Mangrovactinospora gilvigrisea]OIV38323.1 dehydrogenase [Mangrovactinospora gilvigrisea]